MKESKKLKILKQLNIGVLKGEFSQEQKSNFEAKLIAVAGEKLTKFSLKDEQQAKKARSRN